MVILPRINDGCDAIYTSQDVAIRDVINTPRHSLEGSTVRSRPVSVFTPVCRQSPIGNAQPKLAPRRLRRRLCFGLVDAYDAIGQQPTNGSTAAAERLENVIVDDLYDATTSFCDVIDNRGTDSCLSRCQQQPQPLRLCDSRSKTVSWLTCTDNGLPQYVDATDLIGDFSRPYSLPAVVGKHPDLRSISPDVVRIKL